MDFLRSFGAHAAVAVEGAALLEVASSRLRRLETTLREIEGEISGQRDLDALVATISRRAAELLDADTGGVYLLDAAGEGAAPARGLQLARVDAGHGHRGGEGSSA